MENFFCVRHSTLAIEHAVIDVWTKGRGGVQGKGREDALFGNFTLCLSRENSIYRPRERGVSFITHGSRKIERDGYGPVR